MQTLDGTVGHLQSERLQHHLHSGGDAGHPLRAAGCDAEQLHGPHAAGDRVDLCGPAQGLPGRSQGAAGLCDPARGCAECPVNAIVPEEDVPGDQQDFIKLNADLAKLNEAVKAR